MNYADEIKGSCEIVRMTLTHLRIGPRWGALRFLNCIARSLDFLVKHTLNASDKVPCEQEMLHGEIWYDPQNNIKPSNLCIYTLIYIA